eukprot:scaffold82464_cov66-Phaeocystis_antarctica.AAC.7
MELSTILSAPCWRAMAATPATSVTCMRGLVGLSSHTSLVSGRIAARTASRSHMSTFDTLMPCSGATRESSREVPP